MKLLMILVCKGTCTPVAHPFKGRWHCPRIAPLFRRPCTQCYYCCTV